jgi:hypothetical protein
LPWFFSNNPCANPVSFTMKVTIVSLVSICTLLLNFHICHNLLAGRNCKCVCFEELDGEITTDPNCECNLLVRFSGMEFFGLLPPHPS